MKIKIFSGWSEIGGSTIAHINLCNMLNNNGYDCTFYGRHKWHLDKCKADTLDKASFHRDDINILHFLPLKFRYPSKKLILSCHETNIYNLKTMNYKILDCIQFVSESQRKWHDINHKSIVIPNVLSKLQKSKNAGRTGIAGIIGSVDRHKQVHLSIQRAINAGYKKINIYGLITDSEYYKTLLLPLIQSCKEVNIVFCSTKPQQEIYDNIDEVFHSSIRETFNFVKAECQMTGVKYNGLSSAESNAEYLSDIDILKKWETIFND